MSFYPSVTGSITPNTAGSITAVSDNNYLDAGGFLQSDAFRLRLSQTETHSNLTIAPIFRLGQFAAGDIARSSLLDIRSTDGIGVVNGLNWGREFREE